MLISARLGSPKPSSGSTLAQKINDAEIRDAGASCVYISKVKLSSKRNVRESSLAFECWKCAMHVFYTEYNFN